MLIYILLCDGACVCVSVCIHVCVCTGYVLNALFFFKTIFLHLKSLFVICLNWL